MFKFHKKRVNYDLVLGKGGSGEVYAYQKKLNDPNDNKWVVKNIFTKKSEDVINHFQEIVLGFGCENPYVLPVKGYNISYDQNNKIWNIYIKLPRMAKSITKVIRQHIEDKKIIPEDKIVQYFYAVTRGLEYLHERRIAHRDIKPDNILLDEHEKNIRIADFGSGTYVGGHTTDDLTKKIGTLFYAAPENSDGTKQITEKEAFKTDLWGLGMVMFELCTLLDLRSLDIYKNGAKREEQLKKSIEAFEKTYSKSLLQLILKLLRYEPDQRIGLSEVRKILEENYSRYLVFEDLQYSLEMKIKELEEKIKARDREINEMTKYYKNVLRENEEAQKERNNQLEKLLESKKERLY